MSFNKILGYLLLFVGLAIIFWTLYNSYNIFTAKITPPEIFKASETESVSSQKTKTQDLQAQAEEVIREQFKEMLPPDLLPNLFNLISWSIIAGILIFGGSKVSNIGIKLMK